MDIGQALNDMKLRRTRQKKVAIHLHVVYDYSESNTDVLFNNL